MICLSIHIFTKQVCLNMKKMFAQYFLNSINICSELPQSKKKKEKSREKSGVFEKKSRKVIKFDLKMLLI